MSTHAQRLHDLRADADHLQSERLGNFFAVAKFMMLGKGKLFDAIAAARQQRAHPEVIAILEKSAIIAGSTQAGTWGAELAAYTQPATAFLASLRNFGAFDSALADMRQVPMKTQITVVTVGITAASVGEGGPKTISKLTLGNSQLDPIKAIAIVVASDDLLKAAGPLATNLFAQELSNAVAVETDTRFLAEITSGVSTIPSAGTTAAAILQDIGNALGSLIINAQSRVYIAVPPGTAKLWALTLNGSGTFPALTINGGSIAGVTVVPTDALSNLMVAFDATQLAANSGTIELDISNQAAIQMDATPDSPPSASTVATSFWQNNLTGLRAERYFGVERLRAGAVSMVGSIANSPA